MYWPRWVCTLVNPSGGNKDKERRVCTLWNIWQLRLTQVNTITLTTKFTDQQEGVPKTHSKQQYTCTCKNTISKTAKSLMYHKINVYSVRAANCKVTGLVWTRNIFKKIYDEVREDIFDMSNVRIFKEIEKKKWGVFILCYVFGQLSSVKRLTKESMLFQNMCSDASMVQDCWNLAKTRVRTKQKTPCAQMLHIYICL